MNKAFVREPESLGDICPRCGSQGQPVGATTLNAQIVSNQRASLSDSAAFCPLAPCEVAYFDNLERIVWTADLKQSVYPKDVTAPICPCFGMHCDDIDQDVREGSVSRVKALIEKAKSSQARCVELTGNGRSCIPYVQSYYMRCQRTNTNS